MRLDLPCLVEHQHVVALVQPVQVVRHEDDERAALPEQPGDALGHKVSAHLGVHRGEHIVEQYHRGTRIARAREGDTCFLPTTQVDAALANLGRISCGELLEIRTERTRGEHLVIEGVVVRQPEEDVVTQRLILDPRLLRAQRNRAAHDAPALQPRHITHESREQRRLATSHRPPDAHEPALRQCERQVDERRQELRCVLSCRGGRGGRGASARTAGAGRGSMGGRAARRTAAAARALLLLLVILLGLGPLEGSSVHLNGGCARSGWRLVVIEAVVEAQRPKRRGAKRRGVKRRGHRGREQWLDRTLGRPKEFGEPAVDDHQVHEA